MGGGLGARWFWAFGRVPGQRLAGQVNVDLGAAWRLAGWAGYGPVVLIDSVEDGAGDAGSVVMEEDQDIEAIRAPGLNDIVKGGLRKGAAGMHQSGRAIGETTSVTPREASGGSCACTIVAVEDVGELDREKRY
jgi:hypothetical protein